MQTLRSAPDNNDPTKTAPRLGAETDDTTDKIACMLTYLRSLEQAAEQLHGDNDDWRYGRYLVHGAIAEAIKSAYRQST